MEENIETFKFQNRKVKNEKLIEVFQELKHLDLQLVLSHDKKHLKLYPKQKLLNKQNFLNFFPFIKFYQRRFHHVSPNRRAPTQKPPTTTIIPLKRIRIFKTILPPRRPAHPQTPKLIIIIWRIRRIRSRRGRKPKRILRNAKKKHYEKKMRIEPKFPSIKPKPLIRLDFIK